MGLPRDQKGELVRFTFPGSYSVIYLCKDGGLLCAKCANGENGSEASECWEDTCSDQWALVTAGVYWEGPDKRCDHCDAVMASEYGDPDEHGKDCVCVDCEDKRAEKERAQTELK